MDRSGGGLTLIERDGERELLIAPDSQLIEMYRGDGAGMTLIEDERGKGVEYTSIQSTVSQSVSSRGLTESIGSTGSTQLTCQSKSNSNDGKTTEMPGEEGGGQKIKKPPDSPVATKISLPLSIPPSPPGSSEWFSDERVICKPSVTSIDTSTPVVGGGHYRGILNQSISTAVPASPPPPSRLSIHSTTNGLFRKH